MLLDTASNGNFLGQDAEKGLQLVENLATSDGNYGEEYDRTSRDKTESASSTKKEIQELNEKLDRVLQATRRHVNFVSEPEYIQDDQMANKPDEEAEINYIGGQGFNNGYNSNYRNSNLSYRSTNVENPQDQYYPKPAANSYKPTGQAQNNYQQQQGVYYKPFNAPQNHQQTNRDEDITRMLKQVLEGQNKSVIDINNKMKEIHAKVDSMYGDLNTKIENLATQIRSSEAKRQIGTLPGKPETNPKEFVQAIEYYQGESSTKVLKRDVSGSSKGGAYNKGKALRANETLARYKALFEKQLSQATITLPLIEAFWTKQGWSTYIKDAMAEKKKEDEERKFSTIVKMQPIAKKSEDPGRFTLPCTIGRLFFPRCLCDLGASVNLMPLSVAHKLGYKTFKKNNMSLFFADQSMKESVGVLEDLPVVVGSFRVYTDFVILEMEEEPKDPIILGRPFLATTEALVDMKEKKIKLRSGSKTLAFDITKRASNQSEEDENIEDETIKNRLHQESTKGARRWMSPYEKWCEERSKNGIRNLLAMEKQPEGVKQKGNTGRKQSKGKSEQSTEQYDPGDPDLRRWVEVMLLVNQGLEKWFRSAEQRKDKRSVAMLRKKKAKMRKADRDGKPGSNKWFEEDVAILLQNQLHI